MDPADPNVEFRSAPDLAAVGLALATVAPSEANLAGLVAAHANGRSSSQIGTVLGVSTGAAPYPVRGDPPCPKQGR